MKKEIWKSIPGYSYHEASTLGRIRSVDRIVSCGKLKVHLSGKILNPSKIPSGYMNTGVKRDSDNKWVTNTVHRLVALAFLGSKPPGKGVAHLNGIATDNRLENLKYCTTKENRSHTYLHGTHLFGEKSPNAKLKAKDVLNIRKLRKQGISGINLAKKYKITKETICNIHLRKTWKHLA